MEIGASETFLDADGLEAEAAGFWGRARSAVRAARLYFKRGRGERAYVYEGVATSGAGDVSRHKPGSQERGRASPALNARGRGSLSPLEMRIVIFL